MSTTRQVVLLNGLLLMSVALTCSAAVVFSLHVASDEFFGVQREMRSAVGLFFVPILALPLVLITSFVHLAAKTWFDYKTWREWISAGVLYALLFLVFVSPWLLVVPLVVNPISLKWWTKRSLGNDAKKFGS